MYIHMYIHMYVYMYVHIYICTYVSVYRSLGLLHRLPCRNSAVYVFTIKLPLIDVGTKRQLM